MTNVNISSLSEYCKLVQEKIDETLKNEVFNVVKQKMIEVIDDKVYDSYTPEKYKRRGRNYGLLDEDNIVYDHTKGKIDVKNIARPNYSVFGTEIQGDSDTLLAQWIEHGQVPNVFNHNDYVWMHARPFMKTTQEMLQRSSILKTAMRKGLSKRGLKIKR